MAFKYDFSFKEKLNEKPNHRELKEHADGDGTPLHFDALPFV